VRRGADIPQILRLLAAIFRVREARRNEIRSQPSVDSQHGETLGLFRVAWAAWFDRLGR